MSFIGGVFQAILTDFLKDFIVNKNVNQKTSNGCIVAAVLVIAALIIIVLMVSKTNSSGNKDIWLNIKQGDSVFVRSGYGIDFYKKGKIKLAEYEQREVKYAYEYKDHFFEVNHVGDKFFFKNKTSFIGFCAGVDSTDGKWIEIQPSNAVKSPPRAKDIYDFETRRWENPGYNHLHDTKLGKQFYVRLDDILLINNDSTFR